MSTCHSRPITPLLARARQEYEESTCAQTWCQEDSSPLSPLRTRARCFVHSLNWRLGSAGGPLLPRLVLSEEAGLVPELLEQGEPAVALSTTAGFVLSFYLATR